MHSLSRPGWNTRSRHHHQRGEFFISRRFLYSRSTESATSLLIYTIYTQIHVIISTQNETLKNGNNYSMTEKAHLNAITAAIMSLICIIHKEEVAPLEKYVDKVVRFRSENSPHLLPPLQVRTFIRIISDFLNTSLAERMLLRRAKHSYFGLLPVKMWSARDVDKRRMIYGQIVDNQSNVSFLLVFWFFCFLLTKYFQLQWTSKLRASNLVRQIVLSRLQSLQWYVIPGIEVPSDIFEAWQPHKKLRKKIAVTAWTLWLIFKVPQLTLFFYVLLPFLLNYYYPLLCDRN